MRKKVCVLFGFLFLMIVSLNIISALTCNVVSTSSCGEDKIVLKLSGETNAHGALYNKGNYGYALCCVDDINRNCNNNGTILKLSSDTNAHAQAPGQSGYSQEICYSGLECTTQIGTCPNNYNIPMLSISSITNAHLGNFSAYPLKICCLKKEVTEVFWAEKNVGTALITDESNPIRIVAGIDDNDNQATTFDMVVKKSPAYSKEIKLELYEEDCLLGFCTSDLIKNFTKNTDTNGNVRNSWVITKKNIADGGNEGTSEFYFKAINDEFFVDERSFNDLYTTAEEPDFCEGKPILCEGYTTQSSCEGDANTCKRAYNSGEAINVDCEGGNYSCLCVWESNMCKASVNSNREISDPGDGIIDPKEQCDNSQFGNLTCLNFNYTGGSLSCGSDGIIDTSGCTGGTNPSYGYCGDGEIITGETCDGSDWGPVDGCSFYKYTGGSLSCYSNLTQNGCKFDVSECTGGNFPTGGTCGDGIRNDDEECDKSNWGLSCSNFDYARGNLTCGSDCKFNVSRCNGGTPMMPGCGNGIINSGGEQCDGNVWGLFTSCSNFDTFTGGTLSCMNCTYDTSQCTGVIQIPIIGSCLLSESNSDDCNDGFLTYSWSADWTWGDGNNLASNPDGDLWIQNGSVWRLDPRRDSAQCVGGSKNLECPAKIKLPFFGTLNLIIAVILILIIYLIIEYKKKNKKTRNSKGKKKK